jgi:hypothetical protein
MPHSTFYISSKGFCDGYRSAHLTCRGQVQTAGRQKRRQACRRAAWPSAIRRRNVLEGQHITSHYITSMVKSLHCIKDIALSWM